VPVPEPAPVPQLVQEATGTAGSAVSAAGREAGDAVRPVSPTVAGAVEGTTQTAGDAVAGVGEAVSGLLGR
jgi:hypothetical protein